jgi:DNA-binding NarL/FixJ family response regulator
MNIGIRSILIVDDHPLLRDGLKMLVSAEPDLNVCGETGSLREAANLVRDLEPNLVLIDLALEDGNGLDLIHRLNGRYPDIRFLICSMRDESLYAERSIAAGAHGFISKSEPSSQILEAIRQVLAGKRYLSAKVVEHIVNGFAHQKQPESGRPIDRLSNRELEVFWLIGQGLSTTEIAERLTISVKTVETHREKIKRKLGLSSAGELMRYAVQWDLEQH